MVKRQGVAETLRRAIQSSGATLYRVAEDSGVDYAVLHRFVRDGTNMKMSNIEKLADYMGLELRRAEGK